MSKAYLNKIESLQGREVPVDSIVMQTELEAAADASFSESVVHSEGLYDGVFNVTKNGNGFVNRDASLVFGKVGGGLPFVTIQAEGYNEDDEDTHNLTWSYWFAGREIVKTGALTYYLTEADWDKGNYISLSGDGDLVNTGSFPNFKGTTLCAYAHWDSVNETFIIEGDERHGASRDTDWHYSKHREDGMVIRQLGQLSWFANDPAKVGLQLTTTQVADEDLEYLITHSVDGAAPFTQRLEGLITEVNMPTLIFDGTAIRKYKKIVPWSDGALMYNHNGTVVEVPDGSFVNYFLVATHCQKFPIKLIMGRKVFDTAEETTTETLEALGLNFPEIAMLYRITLEKKDSYGTVGNCSIYSAQQAASKNIFESQAGIVGVELSDHAALLGRGSPNQHPIESITNLEIRLTQAAPSGLISMWSGAVAPSGWVLCDGANGTPDLRDRFIVGAGSTYRVGATGGSKDAVVVAHSHTGEISRDGSHSHHMGFSERSGEGNRSRYVGIRNGSYTDPAGEHTHSLSIKSSGVSGKDKNLPPYYALAYIMKT